MYIHICIYIYIYQYIYIYICIKHDQIKMLNRHNRGLGLEQICCRIMLLCLSMTFMLNLSESVTNKPAHIMLYTCKSYYLPVN